MTGDKHAAAAVNRAALFVLVAVGAVALYGAAEMRTFYTDGAYYLQNLLRYQDYVTAAPARRVVEWLRQTATIFAVRLGENDLSVIRPLFSFSVVAAPFLLMAACWFALPRDRKWFYIFPLLHFCAGTLATLSSPFQEGTTASSAFWTLFFFILFRARSTRSVDIAVALSLPTVVLHEAMLFLGPLLAVAAWWSARTQAKRSDRLVMKLLSGWFVVAAAVQIDFIANPRHAGHGAGYTRDLLSGAWIVDADGSFNLSAALGVFALAIVGLAAVYAAFRRSIGRGVGVVLVGGFAVVAGAALAYLWATDNMLDTSQQLRARNNGLLITFPLAAAALVSLRWPALVNAAVVRQAAALCAILGAVAVPWQANGVVQWSRALATFRALLAETRGFVEWDTALERVPPDRRRLTRYMIHDWIVSPLSIVYAPKGQVVGILGTTSPRGFRPFDPLDPANLPRSPAWNLAPYLATLPDKAPDSEKR